MTLKVIRRPGWAGRPIKPFEVPLPNGSTLVARPRPMGWVFWVRDTNGQFVPFAYNLPQPMPELIGSLADCIGDEANDRPLAEPLIDAVLEWDDLSPKCRRILEAAFAH